MLFSKSSFQHPCQAVEVTTTCNCSARDADTLLWLLQATTYTCQTQVTINKNEYKCGSVATGSIKIIFSLSLVQKVATINYKTLRQSKITKCFIKSSYDFQRLEVSPDYRMSKEAARWQSCCFCCYRCWAFTEVSTRNVGEVHLPPRVSVNKPTSKWRRALPSFRASREDFKHLLVKTY